MRTWFKLISWAVFVLGGVGGLLYAFVFNVWVVPSDDPLMSSSIEPTIRAGDVLVVTRHTSISIGNLLRCDDPQAPGRFVVARAIGRFGETVELRDEIVTVDGKRTPSPRACETATAVVHDPQTNDDVELRCSIEDYGDVEFTALRSTDHPEPPSKATIEAGKWYLISDDRHIHLDSRDFGQIDPNTCQHIVYRLVSANGFGDSAKRFSLIW